MENVAAIRRRGLDRVLGDLAKIGYDATWISLRASDVGAPHRRERVFILANLPEAKSLLDHVERACQTMPLPDPLGERHTRRTAPLQTGELELAARYVLRTGQNPEAEEWAVMDYDDFAGVALGEYTSLSVVSRIAHWLAEHGEAFGHWAAHVGTEDLVQLDSFEEHYRGEWESFEAYVDDYLEDVGFYTFRESIPEEMQGYVEVDVAAIARDWGGTT